MKDEKIYDLMDKYLKGQLSDVDRATFIERMKADIELMRNTEQVRSLSKEVIMDEKMSLMDRLAKRYDEHQTPSKGKIIEFSDKKDDRLLEFMNAAYAKNKEFLLSKDSDIDIDMIRKFLAADDEGHDEEK